MNHAWIRHVEMNRLDRVRVVSALDSAWEGLNALLNVSPNKLLKSFSFFVHTNYECMYALITVTRCFNTLWIIITFGRLVHSFILGGHLLKIRSTPIHKRFNECSLPRMVHYFLVFKRSITPLSGVPFFLKVSFEQYLFYQDIRC